MGAEDFKVGGIKPIESYDTGNAEFDISEQKITYTDKQQNLQGVDFKDVSIDKNPSYHHEEPPAQIGREWLFIGNTVGLNNISPEDKMKEQYLAQGSGLNLYGLA